MRLYKTLLFGLALTLVATVASADVSDDVIRDSYHEKAAVTQLMRWFQYYENNAVGLDNQRDILMEGFSVVSPSGKAEGRDQYEVAVQQFPTDWQNAHDVRDVAVRLNEDGTLGLTAGIIYSNIGIAEDGAVSAQRIGYEAVLEYTGDEQLPRFSSMVITPIAPEPVTDFNDTYVQNRLASLVNYWIALVEHPGRDPEPFREILAPELDIKFSAEGDTYTSYDDIATWVTGPVSSLPATRHVISPVSYSVLGDGRYELSVGFDWLGMRPDGKRMSAKTQHTWVVTDDPIERFARVERIRVEMIEPFAIVE